MPCSRRRFGRKYDRDPEKEPYTVIGIVTKAKVFESSHRIPLLVIIPMHRVGRFYYIPNTIQPDHLSVYDEPQNVVIRVDSTDNMTSAGKHAGVQTGARPISKMIRSSTKQKTC